MNPSIQLFNTLHHQKEVFVPLNNKTVSLYTCGPTVYDFAHIGNLRTYIFEDILRRTLEFAGYSVTHAMNITDVGHLVGDGDAGEDKLEVGARREGKHPLEIAQRYEAKFFDDLKKLNVELPSHVQRATEAIGPQIELIQRLEQKGFTYKTKQAVYFDTSHLADYGKLTGQNLSEKRVGARDEVVVDPEKRHPQDFALWFLLTGRYAQHILHWASPWGEGFPGWHVECSAISRQLLGQPFDIHTGGVDHIGTHHTNEIAQSEVAYDLPLARYWLHGEFLSIENKRMGKSEGNLLTLDSVLERGFTPLDFRYLCLMAHYRSKMNFTWEALTAAQRTRQAIVQLVMRSSDKEELDEVVKADIMEAFYNDLDTPHALALLHESSDARLWLAFDPILGLNLEAERSIQIPDRVKDLARARETARQQHNWTEADRLRQEISQQGYMVQDTDSGSDILPKL